MKIIKKARLHYQDEKSDKVYEVDLCEVSAAGAEEGRYVVNFRYGKRGGALREGSKTAVPVGLEEAGRIFDSIVVSKTNKGYQENNAGRVCAPRAASGVLRSRIITSVLQRLRKPETSETPVARAVWRAGELRISEAAPQLLALIGQGDAILDYCVAWALGRCADAQGLPGVEQLMSHPDAAVRRIACEAFVQLASAAQRQAFLSELEQGLPAAVRTALQSADEEQLGAQIHAIVAPCDSEVSSLLGRLYLLSLDQEGVRRALLKTVQDLSMRPNHFKAIRHLFKAAEFRADGQFFGLLVQRIETSKAFFWRDPWSEHIYLPDVHKRVCIDKEIGRPDSRLAFSHKTRDYLRRRSWKTLKNLGQAQDADYVDMASGMLLAYSDEHAHQEQQMKRYVYNDGSWESVTIEYGAFAPYLAFNHILYTHSARYQPAPSRRVWIKTGVQEHTCREEAFPALWDGRPDALLELLLHSRCAVVHEFAVRAVSANRDYCAQLGIDDIVRLLRQAYAPTQQLAFELTASYLQHTGASAELIGALLDTDLDAAHALARAELNKDLKLLRTSPGLFAAIITSRHAPLRAWARELSTQVRLDEQGASALLAKIISILLDFSEDDERSTVIIKDTETLLLLAYANAVRRVDFTVIDDLLSHPLASLQTLGGRCLLQREGDVQDMPAGLLVTLLNSDNADLRGIGVELFGRLPQSVLLDQQDMLAELCVSHVAQVRQAIRAVVAGLVQDHPEFGRALTQALMAFLFRSEPTEGFHRDLLILIKTELAAFVGALDPNTVWRLLHARAKAAQDLGAHLLQDLKGESYSVRQWVHLGRHRLLGARQWAWRHYQENPARIREEAGEGLRLMDSDWDDTRAFAFDYFRSQFGKEDWTPALIINVCDSAREDIQGFGRELLSEYFEEQQGPEYLLKLSQHPSVNVQLFVTHFLERFAADDNQKLKILVQYFLSALSQVNRARVAKTRIFEFLRKEALKSEEQAQLIADILARQSATMAIGDKAVCIETLLDITQHYPQVKLPLHLKTPVIKGANTQERARGI